MKTFAGKLLAALTVVALVFLSAAASAEIRSDVDRRTISMGESLRLVADVVGI